MRAFICAAMLALTTLPAQAITITVQTSNGGAPVVLVAGPFLLGSEEKFKAETGSLSNALVIFTSNGGITGAAFEIGRTIRARGFTTAVYDSYCYSACAIAWLGGTRRYMTVGAQIGFHAAYVVKSKLISESGYARGRALLDGEFRAYAAKMGLPKAAVEWIGAKGPDEFNMLTQAEADRIGIAVNIYWSAPGVLQTLKSFPDFSPTPTNPWPDTTTPTHQSTSPSADPTPPQPVPP
jgi:hypothetical protein